MKVFGDRYSEYYDLLYEDKDYARECDYLERLFQTYNATRVRKVRDVACGTGGHALPLALRKYDVFASDISKHMVGRAQQKAIPMNLGRRIRFAVEDMRYAKSRDTVDACLCMFASIGYLTSGIDIIRALRSMRKCLKPNGLIVLDFWNGLAVLSVRPSRRFKTIKKKGLVLTRSAIPRLDPIRDRCKVDYRITVDKPGTSKQTFHETHTMRYFFPEEMRTLMECSQLEVLSMHPFLHRTKAISESDWNITAVARRS